MERKIMAVALSSTLALSTLIACTSAKSDSSSGSQAGSIVPSFDYICSDAACFERVCEADYGYFEEELVFNTEEYDAIDENGFRKVSVSPLSTFSADVDTASYSNLRRMLNDGYSIEEIPQGAVRAEEMINYFTYDYNGPEEGEPFGNRDG